MDDLRELQSLEDHTKIMAKMRVTDISELFAEYNHKVLLSSFMLYKFREMYNIDDTLFTISRQIADAMVALDFKTISDLYPTYFEKFTEWREKDINDMKECIQNQMEAREGTMTSPRDEADETWNDCMQKSINLMSNKLDRLDSLSKTPPKY